MKNNHHESRSHSRKVAKNVITAIGSGGLKTAHFTHRQLEKPLPKTKDNSRGISRYAGAFALTSLLLIGEKTQPFERLGEAIKSGIDSTTSEMQQLIPSFIHPEIWGDEPSHEKDASIEAFIDEYSAYAKKAQNIYGVPHEVSLAMGILESGYGAAELAVQANNFHGLKANNEWTGPVYQKQTKEHITKEQMDDFSIVGEPVLLSGDTYEVTVVDTFKKFDSAEAGFLSFAYYLKNRFNGQAYADAFEHQDDPYEFMSSLFDSDGFKYATDVEYLKKSIGLLDRITGKNQPVENEQTFVREWDSLSDFEKRAVRDQQTYQKCIEQLTLADVSPEGFEEFKKHIVDESAWIQARSQNDHNRLFPDPDKDFSLVENPRVTLHFTAWQSQQALQYDGRAFIDSVANAGYAGSANAYIALDGTTSVFTKANQASYHAGPEYNKESFGIEIPASNHEGITAQQYAQMAYAVAWRYRTNYPDKKPSHDDMKSFVIGHGEITEVKGIGDHTDIPLFIADAIAGLAHNLLQNS